MEMEYTDSIVKQSDSSVQKKPWCIVVVVSLLLCLLACGALYFFTLRDITHRMSVACGQDRLIDNPIEDTSNIESSPEVSLEKVTLLRVIPNSGGKKVIIAREIVDNWRISDKMYVYSPDNATANTTAVFTTQDDVTEIADIHFIPIGRNFVIALSLNVGDNTDLALLTDEGELITSSILDTNPELGKWHVTYDGTKSSDAGTEVISLLLFTIADEKATAQIDLTTGKLVPNSLTEVNRSN